MQSVRSLRHGHNGTRRWLAKAGIGAFAILGGTAALTLPGANQPELAVRQYQATGVAPEVVASGTTTSSTSTSSAVFTTSTLSTVTVSYSNAATVPAKVVTEALKHRGAPYSFGAAGPNRFDCSGFTQYVFRKFGVKLPHNAAAQRLRGRAVSRAGARPGDIVVFSEGGSWGHVAIYLGNGYIIDAPHSGATVHARKLWTNAVVFRRLIG